MRNQEKRSLAKNSASSVFFALVILTTSVMLATPAVSSARIFVGVSVTFAPPPLPVYSQPICPGPGYIWTPGYWAWDPAYGYYWVPGTWVVAPFVGALWTPGYWGWNGGAFVWNVGYWGPVVGFYGGINYGFGYTGFGYEGGYWNRGAFYYNRTVNNVTNITNVYNRTVINSTPANYVSYNGGAGGITARPTATQLAAASQRRDPPTAAQVAHAQAARNDPAQRASVNHGAPGVAATSRPGAFAGGGVVRASRAGGVYHAPPVRAAANRVTPRTANPAGRATRPLTTAHAAHPVVPAQGRTTARAARPRTAPAARSVIRPAHQAAPRAPSVTHPMAQRPVTPRPQSMPRPTAQRQAPPRPQSVYRPAAQRPSAPPLQRMSHPAPQSAPRAPMGHPMIQRPAAPAPHPSGGQRKPPG